MKRHVEWLSLLAMYSQSHFGDIKLTDMFRSLTQSFGANSRIVPQIGPQKLHFTSFVIYFLLIILSFDTIQPEPLTSIVKRTVNNEHAIDWHPLWTHYKTPIIKFAGVPQFNTSNHEFSNRAPKITATIFTCLKATQNRPTKWPLIMFP
jgi:hypothetical protein